MKGSAERGDHNLAHHWMGEGGRPKRAPIQISVEGWQAQFAQVALELGKKAS
jgi:hypothetical protein